MNTKTSRTDILQMASELPAGSKRRRLLLAGLKEAKGETYFRRLEKIQQEFTKEVLDQLVEILESEGAIDPEKAGPNSVRGNLADDTGFVILLNWDQGIFMKVYIKVGRDKREIPKMLVMEDPFVVASEIIYKSRAFPF